MCYECGDPSHISVDELEIQGLRAQVSRLEDKNTELRYALEYLWSSIDSYCNKTGAVWEQLANKKGRDELDNRLMDRLSTALHDFKSLAWQHGSRVKKALGS